MSSFDQYLSRPIPCACGRAHRVPIRRIDCDMWRSDPAAGMEQLLGGRRALLLCDAHTCEAMNAPLSRRLTERGWSLTVREFGGSAPLVNDERTVGTALLDMTAEIDGIIAVGGGTVTDLGRFLGSRTGKPFVLVMTCPSMDGYASNVAGMMIGGKKKVLKDCRFPAGIFADPQVMCSAPMDLIRSGYGDMLGKRTALPDWVLARTFNGDYYCARIAGLTAESAGWCGDTAAVAALLSRDPGQVLRLTESLVLTGINMALCEDTRPASGSEHIFSHYLVESAIAAGRLPPSHGASVGFGTLVATLLYEFLLNTAAPPELAPIQAELRESLLPSDTVYALLEQSGIGGKLTDYLADEGALREMLRACAGPEKRYTILRYLSGRSLLDSAADYVCTAMRERG